MDDEVVLDDDVQKFMNVYDSRRQSQLELDKPVNLPFEITPDKHAVQIFNGSVGYNAVSKKPQSGAIQTAVGAFADSYEGASIHRYLDDVKYKNPFYEPTPEGWSVADEVATVRGLDPKYYGLLMKAKGPQEFRTLYGKA